MTSYRKNKDPKREHFVQIFSRTINYLNEAFDDSGITVTELADRLHVNKSRVSRVLNGRSNITIQTLSEFAYELGRDVEMCLSPFGSTVTPNNYCSSVEQADTIFTIGVGASSSEWVCGKGYLTASGGVGGNQTANVGILSGRRQAVSDEQHKFVTFRINSKESFPCRS